jgi:nitronate monooxygenase
VGTRFWAAQEAAIGRAAQHRALRATGDDTIRQHVYDVVRAKAWPREYSGRVLHNEFVRKWHGREDALAEYLPQARAEFQAAVDAEDYSAANVIIGEADIVHSMVTRASTILGSSPAAALA